VSFIDFSYSCLKSNSFRRFSLWCFIKSCNRGCISPVTSQLAPLFSFKNFRSHLPQICRYSNEFNRSMNFPFTFIIIGRVNIWRLVQLRSFSKSFTGLFHFCDWYLAGRNINVTTWCFFIQNFLKTPFHSEMKLVWMLNISHYLEVLDFTLHFKG
jgi:hypothetical protein